MQHRTLFRSSWFLGPLSMVGLAGVASCPNNPPTGDVPDAAEVPSPDLGPDMAMLSPAECVAQLSQCIQNKNPAPHFFVDVSKRKEVDLLFVVDNSSSMSPKQRVLAKAIPQFLQKIDATGASYHIGVVTTDVGTLPPGQTSWPGSTEVRCGTQRGDDGLLQNKPCSARIAPGDMNTEFALACKGTTNPLCPDPSFVPCDPWISRDGNTVNVAPTNPGTLTAAEIAQRAFQCIGLVGDYGCGVEAPLESMKRALDGHLPANSGFLRTGSVLVVQFITDEDDCSAQLARRSELSPASVSCSPSDPDPAASCYNLDYRCIARSVQCDESMAMPGLKHNCRERSGNFLESVDTYVRFLQGLRPPAKLVVSGLWSPSVQDFQAAGSVGSGRLEIDGLSGDFSTNVLNRGGKSKAACYDPDPTMMLTTSPQGFFGQAQLRLSRFVRQFDSSVGVERSICDAANYSAGLDQVANKVAKALTVDCLSAPPLVYNGVTACEVGYVDVSQPLDPPKSLLPMCSGTCCQAWGQAATPNRADLGIQTACGAEPVDCYCTPVSTSQCVGTAVAGLWRAGNADIPTGKAAAFRCVSGT